MDLLESMSIRANNSSFFQVDLEHPSVKEACARVTESMAGRGRVLLRKSGTEPLVRVMVEGEDESQVRAHAEALAKLVSEVCV